MIKTEVIKTVGFLEETLFSYFEDLDYSIRLNKAGYKIQYCPEAVLWHKVGAGTKSETYSPFYLYYQTRNRVFVFRKYRGWFYQIYMHIINFFVYFLLRILMIFLKTPMGERRIQIKAVFHGYMDSWKNKLGQDKRWEAT